MVARPGLDLKPILGFIEIRGSMQQLYNLDDGGGRGVFKVDQNGSVLVFLKQIKMNLYWQKVRVTNTVNSLEVGSWRPSLGLALKVFF